MSPRTSHWLYGVVALFAYLLVRIIARYYFHYRGEDVIFLCIIFVALCILGIYLVRRWSARP
jgi:hypothetical protein